jgi:hypothetical protein
MTDLLAERIYFTVVVTLFLGIVALVFFVMERMRDRTPARGHV